MERAAPSASARVLALACLLAVGSPLIARADDGYPRYELHGGYAFLRDLGEDAINLPAGWSAAFAWNPKRSVGVVLDVGGNYKNEAGADLNQHAFLAGVRLTFRGGSLTPYLEALAGGVRSSASAQGQSFSETDFAAQGGVGLAFRLSEGVSLRVGGDFRNIFSEGESFQQFRAIAGIQFGFGGGPAAGRVLPAPPQRSQPAPYQEPSRPAPIAPEPIAPEPLTPVPPRPPIAPDDLGRGRELLSNGQYGQAAAAFREHLRLRAAYQYTVALGLFCDSTNVDQLVQEAGGVGELIVLSRTHRGRACYGVYWGLFDSPTRAAQALTSLPAALRAPGQTAIPVSRLLR